MNKEQALANILEKLKEFVGAAEQPLEYVQMCKSDCYEDMCEYYDETLAELVATIKKELE
jgi:hypothetical protein